MNLSKLFTRATSMLALVFVFTNPAGSEEVRFGDYVAKDFLSEYSKLTPEGGESKAFAYRDPAVDFAKYNKLLVDRIQIWFKDDADYKGIDPTVLKELTDYFHGAIVKAASGAYSVVEEPGPDVLRLRIAVTDLVPNKPEASVVSLVVPFVWLGEAGAGAANDEPGSTPFVGQATVEMEAMDSVTSQQTAAYIGEPTPPGTTRTRPLTTGQHSSASGWTRRGQNKVSLECRAFYEAPLPKGLTPDISSRISQD
jgi:hypothetical protein